MRPTLCMLALAVTACDRKSLDSEPTDTATVPVAIDADQDGDTLEADCDDDNPDVHSGATEVCDGIDNDCDGTTDVDAVDAALWYADVDADGHGDASVSTSACTAPDGYVDTTDDCDPADPTIYPGAKEACDDPVDRNCDGSAGLVDEDGDGVAACEDCDDTNADVGPDGVELCNGIDDDCDGVSDEAEALDARAWYPDDDGDGFGADAPVTRACTAPAGSVSLPADCDDTDPTINPDATEACDDPVDRNCDGSVAYADADGDGVAACLDCDDTSADVGTAADVTWYYDGDADGFGDATLTATGCTAPAGYVASSGDCDDADPGAYPDAPEACTDAVDLNCDGSIGYADADADGYAACEECDDADPDVHPDAIEWCNGTDDDCDGAVDDDAADLLLYYPDADGDGYGDTTAPVEACEAPAGHTDDYTDCDDTRADVNVDGVEVCNAIDDDCNGTDDDAATDAIAWYADVDEDAHGDSADAVTACDPPDGYVAGDDDCDDTRDDINPDQAEVCNGVDDDCDGDTDGGAIDADVWYVDADADGYGSTSTSTGCTAPAGTVATAGDCDDDDAATNPAGVEVCGDGADNDCDGTDNGCTLDGSVATGEADWTLHGEQSNDYLGAAAALGDVDGDGASDVMVGAYGWDSAGNGSRTDGRVYVSLAPLDPADTSATADVVLSSTQSTAAFGAALAILGDSDGDGVGDYAVGAYRYDGIGADAGAVFLYTSHPSGAADDSDADTIVDGAAASDQAGSAVASAGDADGDGLADLLVGVPGYDAGATLGVGAVGLHLGPLPAGSVAVDAGATWFEGAEAGEGAGSALASGDMDGDGIGDVVIAAWLSDATGTDAGSIYVYYGPPASGTVSVTAADILLTGSTAGDQFGRAVALADTDGDGTDDLVVGADGRDNGAALNSGAAYVFGSGTASGDASLAAAAFTGVTGNDYVGRSVAGAGDVDGDGADDLLLGAVGFDSGASSGLGATYLGYGPFAGTTALAVYDARLEGTTAGDAVGYAVAGGADTDADGFADVLLTSVATDTGTLSNNGALWLFCGGGL